MTFRITYTDGRPQRHVNEARFARSVVGRWAAAARVGDATHRFHSAGYARIERVS